MPQREVLGHDCGPRTKEGDEGPQEKSNQAKHAERIRAENESGGTAREAKELQSAEAPMPPFGHPMGFWRGTAGDAGPRRRRRTSLGAQLPMASREHGPNRG